MPEPAMHGALNLDSLAYGCCLVALLGLTAALKVWGLHGFLVTCTAVQSLPSVCLASIHKHRGHTRLTGLCCPELS